MKKRNKTLKLNATKSHSDLMMENMFLSLLKYGQIETVLMRSKKLKSFADSEISYALGVEDKSRGLIIRSRYGNPSLSLKLVEYVRFLEKSGEDRKSGFTRLVKTRFRVGDNSEMGELTLLGNDTFNKKPKVARKAKRTKKVQSKMKSVEKEKKAKGIKKDKSAEMPDRPAGFLSRLGGRLLGRNVPKTVDTKKVRSTTRSGI